MVSELVPFFTFVAGTAGHFAAGAGKKWIDDKVEEVGAGTVKMLFANAVVGTALPLLVSHYELNKLTKEFHGTIPAQELQKLLKARPPKKPTPITVRGVFMPGKLLTMGWWEEGRGVDNSTDWQIDKGIQDWLFSGFEQWAPSWSLTDWDNEKAPEFLVGQIGTHDEADSIMVVVRGQRKARELRDQIKEKWFKLKIMVSNATVTGVLCPGKMLANYVPDDKKEVVERLNDLKLLPKHFILVDEDVDGDLLNVLLDPASKIEHYSGYLWKCMCPADIAREKGDFSVLSSFFIWEHTNFSNVDALNYNLDSLRNKVEYITNRVNVLRNGAGKLALLQEMMPEVKLRSGGREKESEVDKPLLKTDEFVDLIGKVSQSRRKSR